PGHKSLHYLVGGGTRVRTYRGLVLVHDPGTYAGAIREDPLDDVLLTRSGALTHPGEPEALEAWEAEQEALRREEEARRAQEAAELARQREELGRQRAEGRDRRQGQWGDGFRPEPGAARPFRLAPNSSPLEIPHHPDEAACSVCGRVRRWAVRE